MGKIKTVELSKAQWQGDADQELESGDAGFPDHL
jgi:hypothetical protein